MKNWKTLILTAAALVVMSSVQGARGQSARTPANSARSSPNSGIRANDPTRACMAAAVELERTRTLAAALESETRALGERLETEKRTTAILTELNGTRKSENEALRAAIDAKNETIAAKDAVIVAQEKLAGALKAKKPSTLR